MQMKIWGFFLSILISLVEIDTLFAGGDKFRLSEGIFNKYGLDPDIKSYNGWMRVCKNGKIVLYTNRTKLSKLEIKELCNQFEYKDRNRNVETIEDRND